MLFILCFIRDQIAIEFIRTICLRQIDPLARQKLAANSTPLIIRVVLIQDNARRDSILAIVLVFNDLQNVINLQIGRVEIIAIVTPVVTK